MTTNPAYKYRSASGFATFATILFVFSAIISVLAAFSTAAEFPVLAVETMARIAHYTEEHFGVRAPTRFRSMLPLESIAMASGVCSGMDFR